MRVLIIGGTGLISRGIVKHLLARGAEITVFNRAQREDTLPAEVKRLTGDRNQFADFERQFATTRFDVVIDMICFTPEQADSDVRAFRGRCEQFIFCSTVCTYGTKMPPQVLVDESFPQEPISGYGRNKLACEQIFHRAHEERQISSDDPPAEQHVRRGSAVDRQPGTQCHGVGPYRARTARALRGRRIGAVAIHASR